MQSLVFGISLPLVMLITLLRTAAYPLFTAETLIAGAIFVALGFVLGLVLRLLPIYLRLVVCAFLVALVCNVLFRPYPHLPFLGRSTATAMFLIITVVASIILIVFRKDAEALLATVFVALMVGAFFVTPLPSQWRFADTPFAESTADSLPPYVHIVLDEHIGFEQIPSDYLGAERLKNQYLGVYQELGFKVFGNVYVDEAHTVPSFSSFLSLGTQRTTNESVEHKVPKSLRDNALTGENELFTQLKKLGYKISVYRSSYLDLCTDGEGRSLADRCSVYPFSPLLDTLEHSKTSVQDRVIIIMNQVFTRSGLVAIVNRVAASKSGQKIGFPMWPFRTCLNCISSNTMLTRVEASLPQLKPGHALFVHLINPHSPFQYYDDECDPIFPVSFAGATAESNFDIYMGQLHCSQQLVKGFLEKLVQSAAGRTAVVTIHGDHGPRHNALNIAEVKLDVDRFETSMEELGQAAFSTFFAIRYPEDAAGASYDGSLVSLPAVLEQQTKPLLSGP